MGYMSRTNGALSPHIEPSLKSILCVSKRLAIRLSYRNSVSSFSTLYTSTQKAGTL